MCVCVCVYVCVCVCVCMPTPCDSHLALETGPRQFYCLRPAQHLYGKVTGGEGGGGNTWHCKLKSGPSEAPMPHPCHTHATPMPHLQVGVKAMQMSLRLVREMI